MGYLKKIVWIAAVAALFFAVAACQQTPAEEEQAEPNPFPLGTIQPEAVPLTFPTLNADPFAFLNRRIRVTGLFTPSGPPDCYPYVGPQVSWSLIADGFELDVVGLGLVAQVAEEGLSMTIDGIWRRYVGPAGCGENPEERTIWYLEVQQVVSPNPLGGQFLVQAPAAEEDGLIIDPPQSGGQTVTPSGQGEVPTSPPTATPTPDFALTATAEALLVTPTPSPSATPSPEATPTLTLTPAGPTPTLEPTPGPGTPTRTPSPSPTAAPGETPAATPTGDGLGSSGSGTRIPATPQPTETPPGYGPPSYP